MKWNYFVSPKLPCSIYFNKPNSSDDDLIGAISDVVASDDDNDDGVTMLL